MAILEKLTGSGSVKDKERELDTLEVEEEIEGKKANIARLKAVRAELKKRYGRDWTKILKVKAGSAKLEDYYAVDPSLREMCVPRRSRR